MKTEIKIGQLVQQPWGEEYDLGIVIGEGVWRDWVLVYSLRYGQKTQIHKHALKKINFFS